MDINSDRKETETKTKTTTTKKKRRIRYPIVCNRRTSICISRCTHIHTETGKSVLIVSLFLSDEETVDEGERERYVGIVQSRTKGKLRLYPTIFCFFLSPSPSRSLVRSLARASQGEEKRYLLQNRKRRSLPLLLLANEG